MTPRLWTETETGKHLGQAVRVFGPRVGSGAAGWGPLLSSGIAPRGHELGAQRQAVLPAPARTALPCGSTAGARAPAPASRPSSVVPPRSRVQRRLPGRPRPSAPGPGCTLAWPSTRASTRGRYLAQHPAWHPGQYSTWPSTRPGTQASSAQKPVLIRPAAAISLLGLDFAGAKASPGTPAGLRASARCLLCRALCCPAASHPFDLSLITAEQLTAARCGQRVILTLSERTSAFELCAGVKTLHPSPGKSTVTA